MTDRDNKILNGNFTGTNIYSIYTQDGVLGEDNMVIRKYHK